MAKSQHEPIHCHLTRHHQALQTIHSNHTAIISQPLPIGNDYQLSNIVVIGKVIVGKVDH